MKKYILSKKSYDLLRNIDLSEMGNSIRFNNDNCFFETDNVRLLEIILTEEIAVKGMKKGQEECNEYGRAIYGLYDEIYYQ